MDVNVMFRVDPLLTKDVYTYFDSCLLSDIYWVCVRSETGV